ncbi:perlucin-like protein [Branchiostoma lanceolatum]|uniref:perlucin-like protein n=1 Tax=Branchiostoma lanceolatum TaxID=7740 RepID=UPI003453C5F9
MEKLTDDELPQLYTRGDEKKMHDGILKQLEKLEIGVKNLQGKSEETCVATGTPLTCPTGYKEHREVCYKAFDIHKDFHDSAATCTGDGGTLAMPRDAGINAFLVYLMNAINKYGHFWFGLRYQPREGRWEWADGTTLGTGWGSWQPGFPLNHGSPYCARYRKIPLSDQYTWDAADCDSKF